MRRRGAAVVLVAVLALGAGVDASAAQRVVLHYDVYYLMWKVLSIDVASQLGPTAYRTTVDLKTAGLLAVLAPWESIAIAHGSVDGPTMRPAAYRADSTYRDRRQQIDLAYASDGAVRGDVDGVLADGEREDVPIDLRDGTLDPITASAAVGQRLAATGSCAGMVPIFDGLRRYDLVYEDLGTHDLPASTRDPYSGRVRHCRATVHSIAGFLRTGERAGERATAVSSWFAPPVAGAAPVAVRIDLEGSRGTLHVHLAHATKE